MPTSKDIARLHSIQTALKAKKGQPLVPPVPDDIRWLCGKLEIEWASFISSFSSKKPAANNGGGSAQVIEDYGYSAFNAAYPRTVGRVIPWGQARVTWLILKPDATLRARIMAALEEQKQSFDWTKEGGKYIPYPAKWIKNRGWESEVGLFEKPKKESVCATCGYNKTLHSMKQEKSVSTKAPGMIATFEKVCIEYKEPSK